MKKLIQFFKSIYFSNRFFIAGGLLFFLAVLGFYIPSLYWVAMLGIGLLALLSLFDFIILYRIKSPIEIKRNSTEKLSNGDPNPITLYLSNFFAFDVQLKVVDEIPHQFQKRDVNFDVPAKAGSTQIIEYALRPVKRGEYEFGNVNVFILSPIALVQRKVIIPAAKTLPVYPSFIQMRKYEFLAISNRLTLYGVKKIRKLGQNTEFEKIKEYVQGDDIRTINWKATAKKNTLMVNQYIDERAQPIYNVIDMGRNMRMPFNGLSLLDYSINSSLVLSNIALKKFDKAGIITFSHKTETILTADRKADQINKIMELLYKQQTGFLESNFEALYISIRRQINQRSLIILYTNFESLVSAQRQMAYLRAISKKHLLLVVFFVNTELREFLEQETDSTEQIYEKTIAEKFDFEKRRIIRELAAYGIHSLLTEPENLTVNTINKYLGFKSRGMI